MIRNGFMIFILFTILIQGCSSNKKSKNYTYLLQRGAIQIPSEIKEIYCYKYNDSFFFTNEKLYCKFTFINREEVSKDVQVNKHGDEIPGINSILIKKVGKSFQLEANIMQSSVSSNYLVSGILNPVIEDVNSSVINIKSYKEKN